MNAGIADIIDSGPEAELKTLLVRLRCLPGLKKEKEQEKEIRLGVEAVLDRLTVAGNLEGVGKWLREQARRNAMELLEKIEERWTATQIKKATGYPARSARNARGAG